MTISIQLSETLEKNLRRAARQRRLSPEKLAAQILEEALFVETSPNLEEVIAKIKALPPNPHAIRPAVGSLKEALEAAPEDPNFNLEKWQRQWAAVEEEMKAMDRVDFDAKEWGG
ncbi:MAG: hypothetical protein KBF17_04435 [Candidatus Promineofilum sp.]|nr:hypothetical protein [Promineifilum sp.]